MSHGPKESLKRLSTAFARIAEVAETEAERLEATRQATDCSVTPREAALELKVDVRTVYRMIERGDLKASNPTGQRTTRISRSDLERVKADRGITS